MALYEYQCKLCGIIEVHQKIDEPHLKSCPKCQGHDLIKLISRSSFVLKGPGFYQTDYKKKVI